MINNYCDVISKKASDLADAISQSSTKEVIELPNFQRNLVWTKNKKEKFISSLKLGYPVGAILLHKKGEKKGKTQYLIIDGLQRTTTIFDYIKRPTEYDLSTDISYAEQELEKVRLRLNKEYGFDLDKKRLQDEVLNFIGSVDVHGFTEAKGYSAFKLILHFKKAFERDSKLEDLHDDISCLLAKIKENSQIDEVLIPVIEYSGPMEALPDIFTRLNTQGTQLNKYQIYAAMWDKTRIKIQSQEIIEKIKSKYQKYEDAGLSIGDTGIKDIKDYNVFEYLFGLGKWLVSGKNEHYKILFRTEDEEAQLDEAESFIFNIAFYALLSDKSSKKKMDFLDEEIKKVNQQNFEKALLSCIDDAYKILRPVLDFPLNTNKLKRTTSAPISEAQVIAIVVYILTYKYDSKMIEKKYSKAEYENLKANILMYYWYDLSSGFWDRSTDTQTATTLDNQRFHSNVTKDSWDRLFDNYFSEQLSKKHKDRTQIGKKDLLFLRFIYSKAMSAFSGTSETDYHLDHIVPVEILKNKAQQTGGLPISAVGNLCLISKKLNQDKNDLLINEYLDTLDGAKRKKAQNEIENSIFMKINDLPSIRKNISENTYRDFIHARQELLKQMFYKEYEIE